MKPAPRTALVGPVVTLAATARRHGKRSERVRIRQKENLMRFAPVMGALGSWCPAGAYGTSPGRASGRQPLMGGLMERATAKNLIRTQLAFKEAAAKLEAQLAEPEELAEDYCRARKAHHEAILKAEQELGLQETPL